MKQKISLVLKFSIAATAFLGTILACLRYDIDGYSHWSKRLLYFTQLSNIWIGAVCLWIAILTAIGIQKKRSLIRPWMYVLRFIFTVSIALTGLVYCGLLGPFAGDDYNAWSFASILTHAVVPVLSLADFFLDDYPVKLRKSYTVYALIPPSLYFTFACILGLCNVDFGRGVSYPYFFMNLRSNAGVFGFYHAEGQLPEIGFFYWILVILLLIFGLSALLYRLRPHKNDLQ